MKTRDRKEIEGFLKTRKGFSECIIHELTLKDYATTVEVVFDYIWTDQGELRPNLDEPNPVGLRFRQVQELRISNALNSAMLDHPELINWGYNEVALVKVVNDESDSHTYDSWHFNHVALLWEGDRRIDVIFSEFEAFTDERQN